jgi:transcriptional regulator with XRE-family HTH domain
VKRFREEQGITQQDLCGRLAKYGLDLSRLQITKIETGRRPVFDYELVALARALRIPVERLLNR